MPAKLRVVQPLARARLMSCHCVQGTGTSNRQGVLEYSSTSYLLLGQQRGGGGSCAEGWAGN